jgi:hypothetical protein
MVKAFVEVVQDSDLGQVTRLTLRIRTLPSGQLMVEVHASPENARVIAAADDLISEQVDHIALRSGRYEIDGRTVLWCELAPPELPRRI